MWKRKRQGLLYGSVIERLRWRHREDGVGGLGGGNAAPAASAPAVETPDVPPVNGGPDRDFNSLSNATIDDPAEANPASSATGAAPAQAAIPADPNQRAGATQSGQQPQQGWQSIRDAAAAQGFQFDSTVTDDRTALNFLLRQAGSNRQTDYYAQLGRQLAPQAPQILQHLQQQRQQPQAPAERPSWEAPEFDERWVSLVDRDPQTGLYVAKAGVPHDIATKVNAFVTWKSNYDRNPAAVLNSMVESRAKDIARSTFQEQFAEQQRESTIRQIVAENGQWLYQVDQATGQQARDYMGNPIYSPVGAAYVQQLQAVRNMGVTDPRQQDALAKQLVRGQIALAAQQSTAAGQNQATNPQTQQAAARPNTNPLQAQQPSQRRQDPNATDPSQQGLSLAERINLALKAEGVTDDDIALSAQGS